MLLRKNLTQGIRPGGERTGGVISSYDRHGNVILMLLSIIIKTLYFFLYYSFTYTEYIIERILCKS